MEPFRSVDLPDNLPKIYAKTPRDNPSYHSGHPVTSSYTTYYHSYPTIQDRPAQKKCISNSLRSVVQPACIIVGRVCLARFCHIVGPQDHS
eukprot:scaffold10022_cov170-Amphora_coffeaeformis.AAC.6